MSEHEGRFSEDEDDDPLDGMYSGSELSGGDDDMSDSTSGSSIQIFGSVWVETAHFLIASVWMPAIQYKLE